MTGPGELRFSSQLTPQDLYWSTAALTRSSGSSLAIGTFLLVIALVAIVMRAWDVSTVFALLLGLSFLTGIFTVPFAWWMLRKRADLLLARADVRAGEEGIAITSAAGAATQPWSAFRAARETSRVFILDTGMGVASIVAKSGMRPDEIDAFAALLERTGLLRRQASARRRLRPLGWMGLGAAAALIVIFGSTALAMLDPEGRLEMDVSVTDRRVTVAGSTDLPDGALLAVEVYHVDEWERFLDQEQSWGDGGFDWLHTDEVRVQDGSFAITADVAEWPPGRGAVVVFFFIHPDQPPVVHERYGPDGTGLRGPHVVQLGDGSLGLEAEVEFAVPS